MIGTWIYDFYTPYTLVLTVGIPISTMSYCYIRMFLALNESKKRFHSSKKDTSELSSAGHKLRLAQINIFQTCLLMTVLFLLSWLTAKSAQFLYAVGIYKTLGGNHFALGNLAVVINSGVNPFVYVLRYDDFKQQLKKLFKSSRRYNDDSIVMSKSGSYTDKLR